MKVICALCDTTKNLEVNSQLAKKLRNNPIKIFICDSCYNRITEKSINKEDEKNI